MKLITNIFFSLLLLLQATSCVSEDLDACAKASKNTVTMKFSYSAKDNLLRGINPDEVESITLYVFDDKGLFVESINENDITLNNEYAITLQLASGTYRFISWGNLSEPYFTTPPQFEPGVTTFNSAQLYLRRPTSNFITTKIPPLFFGTLNSTITDLDKTLVMPLLQDTNLITIITKGLTPSGDSFEFTIADNNSKYYFDNTFAPDTEFKYIAILSTLDATTLKGNTTVMRLDGDRQAMLEVYNRTQDYAVYRRDLVDLLIEFENQNANVGIDWENTHQYEIVLTFNPDMTVTITINGWNVVTDDVQLPSRS